MDLATPGQPGQSGHPVMADVSSSLLQQFAAALAAEAGSSSGEPAEDPDEELSRRGAARVVDATLPSDPAAQLNPGAALARPIAKRVLPVTTLLMLAVTALRRVTR